MGIRLIAAVVLAGFASLPQISQAITLTDYNWTGAIDSNWQADGNWSITGFPNAGTHSAIVTVGSDLTLDVGLSDVTVAALTLNGTNAGTDINVVGTGGKLIFQNSDDNVGQDPAPGNANVEDTLAYTGVNFGRVYVMSNGATGSTNTITAPIRLQNNGFLEGVDFLGNQNVTLAGPIDIVGAATTDVAQLRSYLPTNKRVVITGAINLTDAGDNTTARVLTLNNYSSTDNAQPPRGIIEISGVISGTGSVVAGYTWDVNGVENGTDDAQTGPMFDPAPAAGVPLGAVILSGANTFTGNLIVARGNVVVANDQAFGANSWRQGGTAGNSKEVGYNVISTDDARKISITMDVAQWQTVRGATGIAGLEGIGDHSIEFSGVVEQTNQRGWVNILPEGKTLTLSGAQYPIESGNTTDTVRTYTFDGTGKTIVTGGIHNKFPDGGPTASGALRKRGTGTLVVDYNEENMTDTASDYSGDTFVEGGNLHFAANDDLGNGGVFVASGGAVGVDSGVIGNTTFLSMFNNSSSPDAAPVTPPFFRVFNTNTTLFNNYDSGGLMLASGEYGQNLDFNTGSLTTVANMSLAARETGSTYTGTITPSTSVAVNPNTYQLGGGSGKLTLPNANQLTGARNLLVTNGGEVALTNSNNYTGATKIVGKIVTSLQDAAAVGTADTDGDSNYAEENPRIGLSTTLTVSTLANGGSASSIGSSSNAAANLIVQGGTLKYAGGAVSTDRLFTVGTRGATLDASGSGAVNFANTAALDIQVAPNRSGVWSDALPTTADNEIFGVPSGGPPGLAFNTDDLVPGMVVRNSPQTSDYVDDDSPLVITSIASPHAITVGETDLTADNANFQSAPAPWPGTTSSGTFIQTFDFGPAPARSLTLSGTNTGNNTLASLIGDAADRDEAGGGGAVGGAGSVGIAKTGAGKWILTGNNTYTGTTTVSAGTLLVNGNQTGAGATTVASGATFGGTGQIGGALTLAAGSTYLAAFAGGTIDSLNVVGNVDLTALANALSITGSGVGTSWTLLTYTGTLTGTFESTPGYSVNYGTGANSLITISLAGPVGVQGDYNGNGIVDAADYSVWRDHLGQTFALSNEGTGVTTGVVTVEDYNFWKTRFGATSGNGSGAGATQGVPEPSCLILAAMGLGLIGWKRRR